MTAAGVEIPAATDEEAQQLLVLIEGLLSKWKGNPGYARKLQVEHELVSSVLRMRYGLQAIRQAAASGTMPDGSPWCHGRVPLFDYCCLLLQDNPAETKRSSRERRTIAPLKRRPRK